VREHQWRTRRAGSESTEVPHVGVKGFPLGHDQETAPRRRTAPTIGIKKIDAMGRVNGGKTLGSRTIQMVPRKAMVLNHRSMTGTEPRLRSGRCRVFGSGRAKTRIETVIGSTYGFSPGAVIFQALDGAQDRYSG